MLRAAAVLVVAAALGPPVAAAQTPARSLATQLKTSMQAYYVKSNPGFEMGAVRCAIAKSGRTARCNAHFTIAAKQAEGDFVVGVTFDAGKRTMRTKTLSAVCRNSKTRAKLPC